MSETNIIEIKGLSKRFSCKSHGSIFSSGFRGSVGRKRQSFVQALDGVDITVRKGEVIGILGPNGAGKTTMLKVMAGFLYPDSGLVRINGLDVIEDRHEVRCSCNFLRSGGWVIFDYKYPLDGLLEYWGVFMGLTRKEATKAAVKALETVGLGDKRKEFTENLSAGMRQKLNLARCIMVDRPIYLLDEPTANIDPYSSEFIRTFVRDNLVKRGITVVLATHNLWEAEKLCDRVLILDKGKVLKVGTAEEIKHQTADDVLVLDITGDTESLVGEVRSMARVVKVDVLGNSEGKFKGTHRLSIFGKDMHSTVPDIMEVVRKHGKVGFIDMQTPSLNDIFIQLMTEQGGGK